MSETLVKLEPLEVEQQGIYLPDGQLLLPDQRAVVYPGSDAWLAVESKVADPGSNPAWCQVERIPGTPAIPAKPLSTTFTPPVLSNAQAVFGSTSLQCTGGGGRALQTPDHPDWNLGGGDFTLEGRFYHTAIRKAFFAQQQFPDTSDKSWEWTMDVMGAAAPGFTFYAHTLSDTGAAFEYRFDQGFVVSLNVWYHMACVRSGGNLMFFVDGVQQGASQSIAGVIIRNSSAPLRILGDARAAAGGNDFQGYCDELRISNVARWTSNFTPPSAPYTRDANTLLLCHFEGTVGTTPSQDDSGANAINFDPGSDPAWLEVQR